MWQTSSFHKLTNCNFNHFFTQIIKDLVTLFPVIRDWIAEFLEDNRDMTASMIGRNMLIEQVSDQWKTIIKSNKLTDSCQRGCFLTMSWPIIIYQKIKNKIQTWLKRYWTVFLAVKHVLLCRFCDCFTSWWSSVTMVAMTLRLCCDRWSVFWTEN